MNEWKKAKQQKFKLREAQRARKGDKKKKCICLLSLWPLCGAWDDNIRTNTQIQECISEPSVIAVIEILKLLVYYCVVIVSTKHDWTNLVTDQLLTDLFIAWPCSLVVLCNSPNKTQMFPFSRPWGKHFFVTPESNLFDVVERHIQLFPREKTVDGCGGASAVGNDCMLLAVKQASDLQSKSHIIIFIFKLWKMLKIITSI